MNKLSTEDAEELCLKILDVIQSAPRRMKEHEIEEAVTMAYKRTFGISVEVELVKHYTKEKKEPISELIRKALIQWAYDQGWNKTCLVDVMYETPKGDNFSHVTFEVAHEVRIRYIAIVKKDWITNKVSIIEVKKK